MLDKSEVICFVATKNAALAREFYEGNLGLAFISEDRFAVVLNANGTMLRIQKVEKVEPRPYTALGWRVSDIRKEAGRLAKRGVTFARYPGMQQDDLGIWSSPGGAKIAWFLDPDQNILSITEFSDEPRREHL